MKPNTIIEFTDGQVATIVYSHLDGYGGMWGRHKFPVDDLPEPEFMLRDILPDMEEDSEERKYRIIKQGSFED